MLLTIQRGLVCLFMLSLTLIATGCHSNLHRKHFTGGAPRLFPVSLSADEHRAPWKVLERMTVKLLKAHPDIWEFSGSYDRHIPFTLDSDEIGDPVFSRHWKIVAAKMRDDGFHVNLFVFPADHPRPDLVWHEYRVDLETFTDATGLRVFANQEVDDNQGL